MKVLILKTNQTMKVINRYMDKFEQEMLKLSNLIF